MLGFKNKFKKVLVGILLLCSVNNLMAEEDYTLQYNELYYMYNHNTNVCDVLDFGTKKYLIEDYRKGNLLVIKKYINDAGTIVESAADVKGATYKFYNMTTYGACMLYKDVVILDKKNTNTKDYENLVDPKIKKTK